MLEVMQARSCGCWKASTSTAPPPAPAPAEEEDAAAKASKKGASQTEQLEAFKALRAVQVRQGFLLPSSELADRPKKPGLGAKQTSQLDLFPSLLVAVQVEQLQAADAEADKAAALENDEEEWDDEEDPPPHTAQEEDEALLLKVQAAQDHDMMTAWLLGAWSARGCSSSPRSLLRKHRKTFAASPDRHSPSNSNWGQ